MGSGRAPVRPGASMARWMRIGRQAAVYSTRTGAWRYDPLCPLRDAAGRPEPGHHAFGADTAQGPAAIGHAEREGYWRRGASRQFRLPVFVDELAAGIRNNAGFDPAAAAVSAIGRRTPSPFRDSAWAQ